MLCGEQLKDLDTKGSEGVQERDGIVNGAGKWK